MDKEKINEFDFGIRSKTLNVVIPDKEGKLMEVEERLSAMPIEGPVPIGIVAKFIVDFNSLSENCFGNYCYKELIIQSENSKSMGIVFDSFYLSENAEFYIVNEEAHYLQGPIRAEYVSSPDKFISALMPGDKLKLLLVEPVDERGKSSIKGSKVSHGIVDFHGAGIAREDCNFGFNCSAECNNNVNCFSDYQTEANAVCLIVDMESGPNIMYYGSGSLINNGKQDFEPIILTSGHTAPNLYLDHLQFVFHYRSPQCSPNTEGPLSIWVQGAQTLGNTVAETDLNC
ncbi:hypothetical protein [Negadavirga shengliensis]|uniref:Uncharacterized protein n=1 Tax=Negadavirga shengliensis TaxID=1389218 RepID=A0ABV9T4J8_9BACT